MGVDKAYNYRLVDEKLATAGRLEPEQLAQLGQEGFEVVINLLPESSQYAVAGEQQSVEDQGIEYLYLPVDFAAPTREDYAQFRQLMQRAGDRKLLVHCAANYRASAFYSRYAIHTGRWSEAEADRFMLSVWQPDEHPPWPRWLEEVTCPD
jgi:uncharacterized protein (TIGR01244 family)